MDIVKMLNDIQEEKTIPIDEKKQIIEMLNKIINDYSFSLKVQDMLILEEMIYILSLDKLSAHNKKKILTNRPVLINIIKKYHQIPIIKEITCQISAEAKFLSSIVDFSQLAEKICDCTVHDHLL